jgi:hypothetical protein
MPKFEKGKPRHPKAGRRKGTPNRGTERAKRLISAGDDNKIIGRTIAEAKAGNIAAQAIYYRFLRPPPPRPKFIAAPVELPQVVTAKEAVAQIAAIVTRVGSGDLDLEGSQALIEGLKAFVAAHSAIELEDEVMKAKLRDEGQ